MNSTNRSGGQRYPETRESAGVNLGRQGLVVAAGSSRRPLSRWPLIFTSAYRSEVPNLIGL